jgi:hypothetical protein
VAGRRFHLRLYLLLLRREGQLEASLHRRGKCVYASQPDRGEVTREAVFTDGKAAPEPGSPFELCELEGWLSAQGRDPSSLVEDLEDLLRGAVEAAAPHLGVDLFWEQTCFQLMGVDVLLREDLEPLLIELNRHPGLTPVHAADAGLKRVVMQQTLARAGVIPAGPGPDGFVHLCSLELTRPTGPG